MRKVICLILCVIQGVGLLCSQNDTLNVDEVFKLTSLMNGFQEVEYIEDDIEFPKEIGTPKMIIHGNAEPREQVLSLLHKLPKGSLVYDSTDERGKFDRIFLDRKTYELLYVHIGLGGNDTVLILFRDGAIHAIDKFINELNAHKPN